jgi:hypothetical protein
MHVKTRTRLLALVLGLASVVAHAATFNQFGPANGVLKGSTTTPVTTAAVSSDITAMFTGTCNVSSFLRGDGACASVPAPAGAALTRVDDTNVTLTLGGTPSTALLQATSLTLGWTGTLAASRGGLGMTTVTDDTVPVANGSTWQSKALPDCDDSAGQHLNYDTGTNAWSCGTSGATTFANPSATIGLSATNGAATTAMRSDAAPALSQSIAPTWTGQHTFTEPLLGGAESASLPTYSFAGDPNTGMYSAAGDNLRIAAGGAAVMGFTTTQLEPFVPLQSADGSVSSPTYTFSNDPNTGLYRSTTDEISIATGGGQRFAVGNTGVYPLVPTLAADGSVAAPTYSFINDPNTGLYREGTDIAGVTAGGTLAALFGPGVIYGPAGSASAPGYSFITDNNTGLYLGGTDTLVATVGGTQTLVTTAAQTYLNAGVFTVPSGSATAPGFSFNGDDNTGLYHIGADNVGISLGGTLRYNFSATAFDTETVLTENGSVGAPSYAFVTDTDNGLYLSGTDTVSVSTGATQTLEMSNGRNRAGAGSNAFPAWSFIADNNTGLYSVSGDVIGIATNGTNRVTVGPGVIVGAPTGGDQGAGTINATAIYDDGVLLAPGVTTSTATFTGTLTGVTSGTCAMQYRITGSHVEVWNDSAGDCTGTSNATTFTITGLPAAAQPAHDVCDAAAAVLIDAGNAGMFGSSCITSGTGTITLSLASTAAVANRVQGAANIWTNSGSKGIRSFWRMAYDLNN